MSGLPRVSLSEVQSALSHLHFAVSGELASIPTREIMVGYHAWPSLGLYVEVEVKARYSQSVADRLNHGVMNGPYDYRFNAGRELSNDPDAWVKITAYPRLSHQEPVARAQQEPSV